MRDDAIVEFKYLRFEPCQVFEKTSVWNCLSRSSGAVLGQVKWYGPWRRYCYFPACPAVYSPDCLKDIAEFLEGRMTARRSG